MTGSCVAIQQRPKENEKDFATVPGLTIIHPFD
jgi:hypothetical protein